jgi:hypothetical protein
VLSLKDNNLRSPGAEALVDAIRDNIVLTDLNLASNHLAWHGTDGKGDDMSGVTALASAIKDNGAILKFTFSGDDDSKSVTMETTMAVVDFSGKGLGVSGTIMLSAFLPKCA